MTKCYSTDGEHFELEFSFVLDNMSVDDSLIVGQEYYRGTATLCDSKKFADSSINMMLDALDERIFDDVGDYWNSQLSDASDSSVAELSAFIAKWINENSNYEKFYNVHSVETVAITENDIREWVDTQSSVL